MSLSTDLEKCKINDNNIWEEIRVAKDEKRHELILSGKIISNRISQNGLDAHLYQLENLNYLNLSETVLDKLSEDIGSLKNLTNLVLHSNQLSRLPECLGHLPKLKVLDVSRNSLKELPASMEQMEHLMTLNASHNQLTSIPNFQKNIQLANLDLSFNKFQNFPDLCYPQLVHLSELKLCSNEIISIPIEIINLASLKHLDLNNNCLEIIPGELSDLHKLKELNLKQNKLKDKRFAKLIDQSRNSKQIFDYIKNHCVKTKKDNDKKGQKQDKSHPLSKEEILDALPTIRIVRSDSSLYSPPIQISCLNAVMTVRPHIICCIIRDIAFTETTFKAFIQLQTKLHETVCEKRQASTIATHDLDKIISIARTIQKDSPEITLYYEGRPPNLLQIQPLGRNSNCSSKELMQKLQNEAEALRKEKKRNVYSGVHKYLHLLEGQHVYPCLTTNPCEDGVCLSFPPITNSEQSKISIETKHVLIEVTSNRSEPAAKLAADTLLIQSLNILKSATESNKENPLIVQQIKITSCKGDMRSLYPSRVDLKPPEESQKPSFNVIRDS